jgi:YfiH family protein
MALIRAEREGLVAWQFEHLASFEGLCHGVFTRQGGVSRGPFVSLNTSFSCGDQPDSVRRNRARIARWAGLTETVYLNQVHGDDVLVIKRDAPSAEQGPATADAVVTDLCNRLLIIQVADCQAILLFDPVRRVIGNVHSGWRSSVSNILGKTVAVLTQRFGCRPADMRAGIAPSLGPCCAEFVHYRRELPPALWPYKDQRDRFDFWAISRDQLLAAGLRPDAIVSSGVCTRCHTEQFYSYRASRRTGRFAVVIGLR